MAAIQQDAFQIMMSAKSIDQSEFAEQDKAAFQQHWNKVFVNKLVSAHIYDAISAKSAARRMTRKRMILRMMLLLMMLMMLITTLP